MENKHKSETVTQQETRYIRSQVVNEHKVVASHLLVEGDVECFRSAISNIHYRSQVIHECVTCKTQVRCYAVATTHVEIVLFVNDTPPPRSSTWLVEVLQVAHA